MKILVGLFFCVMAVNQAQAIEKKYRVTITSAWSLKDHLGFPDSAHFSPVVSVVHDSRYTLLPIGKLASPGLKELAETGQTKIIKQEIDVAMNTGFISSLLITRNQFVKNQPQQIFEVVITQDQSFLSFVSMIAPSPDWIIGLSNIRLYSNRSGFLPGITSPYALYAINAGTEDGDQGGNFSINNPPTNPQQMIRKISPRESGFGRPFAYVTIEPIE